MRDPMSPVVLVTGATGFLGGNLARALCLAGCRVRVLARGGRRPAALDGLDYEMVDGGLADEGAVARAVDGCRQVYHAAASVVLWCRSPGEREAVRRVNVGGTRAILRAAAAAGVERVVHVSTVDAIGLPPPGGVADETTDWPPGRIDTDYAETKREAEAVALAMAADVDTVVVNPTFIIGGFDPKPSSGRLLLPLLRSPIVVYPSRGGNNFVHVKDAVAGTIAAMQKGRRGERYILGGENLTYRELFVRAVAVTGRRALMLPVGPRTARLAGRLLETRARVFGGEPALTTALARLAFADHYYDASKAVRELGLPHTPIDQALAEALHWLGTNGRCRRRDA
jgi:dihydroflavonol-4-reductase